MYVKDELINQIDALAMELKDNPHDSFKMGKLITLVWSIKNAEPTEWYELHMWYKDFNTDQWEWQFHSKSEFYIKLQGFNLSAVWAKNDMGGWYGICDGYLYRITHVAETPKE